MKMMVDAVGTDVMGVCLDSGNPVWMLEDPHMTLEMLVPYALTSHVRDSAVWLAPDGINVRWVNMGEGNVDIDGWIRKFVQAKPGLPICSRISSRGGHGSTRSTIRSSGTTGARCRPRNSAGFARSPNKASRSSRRPAGRQDGWPAEDRGPRHVRPLHAGAAPAPVKTGRVTFTKTVKVTGQFFQEGMSTSPVATSITTTLRFVALRNTRVSWTACVPGSIST